jgi:oleate hydratase
MNLDGARHRHCLVGGGIASLAAAVFLIRDAGVSGEQITVFEQLDRFGGSLDGSGGHLGGYLVRGARMFEENFACTFDLLRSIPASENTQDSVYDDILAFNRAVRGSSKCRLVRQGRKVDVSSLGLRAQDILALNRLLLRTERSLEDRAIDSCFGSAFFETNFWLMWSTMFSFQPWHSAIEMRRYLKRFIHLFPGIERIEGVLRPRYNQYDSIIVPILRWLRGRGVQFQSTANVTDIEFVSNGEARCVSGLVLGDSNSLKITPGDRVYMTLGSMTDATTIGSNERPPGKSGVEGGAWRLWRNLSSRQAGFGNPEAFCRGEDKTGWVSFTATLYGREFLDFLERFTGNVTGTGGLVTFADSGWLLSVVMFHQPHFRDQAADAFVFWGYGLRSDRPGDFVRKPMRECSGDEIATELSGQLGLGQAEQTWLRNAKIVPCRMPHITSQFMPRRFGDRPLVRPAGAENFAIMGQYCEIPHDTVFTGEYSVRSAMVAVREMTGLGKDPPPVVRTDRDLVVLLRAARKLFGI